MQRKHWAFLLTAMLATACGVARSSEEDQKQAVERRVAELEQKLAAAEQASAAGQNPTAAEPPAAVPAAPAKATPARRIKAAARPAPVTARRVETRRSEPMPLTAPEPDVAATPERTASDPAPSSRPQLHIPKDTTLHLVLEDALSSERSQPGDAVVARIERAVTDSGDIALPGGSYLEGRVAAVQSSGRVKGKARLDVAFDRIVVRGSRYRLQTTGLTLEAEDSHRRDAAVVAGGTVVGAILGKIAGGSAGKGALVGGAAGGGTVLATKGKEIDLPAGSRQTIRVTRSREIEG
jgi:hypothetical protein